MIGRQTRSERRRPSSRCRAGGQRAGTHQPGADALGQSGLEAHGHVSRSLLACRRDGMPAGPRGFGLELRSDAPPIPPSGRVIAWPGRRTRWVQSPEVWLIGRRNGATVLLGPGEGQFFLFFFLSGQCAPTCCGPPPSPIALLPRSIQSIRHRDAARGSWCAERCFPQEQMTGIRTLRGLLG